MSLDTASMDRPIEKRSRRKLIVFAAGASGVVLIMVIMLVWARSGRVPKVRTSDIVTAVASIETFRESVSVNTTATSREPAVLTPQVGGVISALHVSNGDFVAQGSALMTLSNPKFELELASRVTDVENLYESLQTLQVSIENARFDHKRSVLGMEIDIFSAEEDIASKSKLAEKGFFPARTLSQLRRNLERQREVLKLTRETFLKVDALRQAQLKSAQRRHAQAKRNLEIAQARIDNAVVRASFDGQLTGFNHRIGETVAEGQNIGEIQSPGDIKLVGLVDEFYRKNFVVGQNAQTLGGRTPVTYRLSHIDPNVLQGGFNAEWMAQDASSGAPALGQTVRLRHFYSGEDERLVIVRDAFYDTRLGNYLYIVDPEGYANRRTVEFGRQSDRFIEILSGVKPGERAIISSYAAFMDHRRIEVVSEND